MLQTAEDLFQDKSDNTASVWSAVSHYVAEAYHAQRMSEWVSSFLTAHQHN